MANIDNMARQNMFEVEIRCPALGLNNRGLRVRAASFPGKSFETALFTEVASGPNRPYVTKVVYSQDVTLTFINDSTMMDKQSIELWQEYIYDDDFSIRYPLEPETGYVGEVVIKQLDRGGNEIYAVTLHEAFPQLMGPQALDMESSAISTFDVTFGYRTWSSEYENIPEGTILSRLAKKFQKKLKNKVRKKVEDVIFKDRGKNLVDKGRSIIDKII